MDCSKKLSIVIPVYNGQKYLARCLDSVCSQLTEETELILVDDGSTDSSLDICEKYVKSCGVSLIKQANQGVSTARFNGSKLANGEYVWFIDCDDMIVDGAVATILSSLSKFNYPDMLCFNGKTERSDGTWFDMGTKFEESLLNAHQIKKDIYPWLIQTQDAKYFNASLCINCMRRSLYLKNALVDKRATVGEDQATVICSVIDSTSMALLPDYLYVYKYNDASATKQIKPLCIDYPYIINQHIQKKIDGQAYDFQNQLYLKIIHDLFYMSMSQFYGSKKNSEVKKCLSAEYKKQFYLSAVKTADCSLASKIGISRFAIKWKLFWFIKAAYKIK